MEMGVNQAPWRGMELEWQQKPKWGLGVGLLPGIGLDLAPLGQKGVAPYQREWELEQG